MRMGSKRGARAPTDGARALRLEIDGANVNAVLCIFARSNAEISISKSEREREERWRLRQSSREVGERGEGSEYKW